MNETQIPEMPPQWHSFMKAAGALIDKDRVQHFGNPMRELRAAAGGEIIADLSHYTLACAHGADAEKFLQGQFTNDIRLLNDELSQLSAYCSPKGRTLALTRFFRCDGRYYFVLPAALLEATLTRLRKFVLMSKVTLETAHGWAHIGYSDPHGGTHLREALGADLPTAVNDVVHAGGVSVIRVPGTQARFELFGECETLKTLWQKLDVHAAPVGAGPWEYLEILAGLPCVYPETADAFVPQMLNLDLLGGINFKKGCYTGQEVVARMHYLGKLKRRLYRLHCESDTVPMPGTPLFHSQMRTDESAGAVVRAQAAPDGGCELLAVLQSEAAENGELHLGEQSGPPCQRLNLPYKFEAGND